MNHMTLYQKISETTEKIKNKEDMQDIISNINEISHDLYEEPLYHEFMNMMSLFQEVYDTCLLANAKGEDK